jgi:hypothetical protein
MATEGTHRGRKHVEREAEAAADTTAFGDEEPLPSLLGPSLLTGLSTDDDRTVHTAGYGLFVLARTHEAAAGPIAAELADRLVRDGDRAVRRTLASLRLADDDAVREALLDATAGDRARRLYAAVRETEPWDPPAPLPEGDHAEHMTAFRQLVELDDDDREADTAADSVTDVIENDEDEHDDETESEDIDGPRGTEPADDSGRGGGTKRERIARLTDSEDFATLVHRSGFDDLQAVTPERERRYADAFRARARADDTERGVAVRLLHDPDGGIDDAASDALAAWARLVEAEGIVTVVDWGTTPRPWVATECVSGRLPDRGRVPPAAALAYARDLTGALVALHQQDVVHAGIDPGNVVYAEDSLDGGVRPMLDNVGLLNAYRHVLDPRDYLDPRYAAPEYFDSQYGRIDHATDIYQLGMVVYRLLAGCHPFDGGYTDVREAVLDQRPTTPSECTPALPSAIDEVVAKATAKQKLTRYETAHGFHQDISRICDAVLE